MTAIKVKITATEAGKAFAAALKNIGSQEGKVGWFNSNRYPTKQAPLVAKIAATQEFGYPEKNIPARPFIRPTMQNKKNKWMMMFKRKAQEILEGKISLNEGLSVIANVARGDVVQAIKALDTPPLKAATIRNRTRRSAKFKGLKTKKAQDKLIAKDQISATASKPLVDTGIMLDTLSATVERT